MRQDNYSSLFKCACQVLKYFFWVLFGLAIAYLISVTFGVFPIAEILQSILSQWFSRFAIIVICFLFMVVVLESCR